MATGTLVIRNIGLLLTGKMEAPISDADCIVTKDGIITAIGRQADLDIAGADITIDAQGVTVAPGLIDSHVHPVIGDYTPRQQQLHWIDSTLHGGVTTMISAGEVHMPGRPNDVIGTKALAIASQRWYENLRPSGVKVHAGAPLLQHGMEEHDFKEMADAGVKLIGEVGLGTVKDGPTAKMMIDWARKYGMQSTIHTGGPSIPGSGLIGADVVLEAGTDVVGHINGGHSALPDSEIVCLCEQCSQGLEIVHNGNERAALLTLNTARELKKLDQIILGTDGPAGSGVQPLGILRMIAMLSALGNVPAGDRVLLRHRQHVAGARTRRGHRRGGPPGRLCPPRSGPARPGKTVLESIALGNLPGVGMTVIDGVIRSRRSRNTPPAMRLPVLVGEA